MTLSANTLLQKTALTFLSAVLFVSTFQLNNLIFSGLSFSEGISWVFLPAGFRIVLVLVLGWPGALGLVFGSWFLDSDLFDDARWKLAFFNGLVSGLVPGLVLWALRHRKWVDVGLKSLTAPKLLQMTLLFAGASTLSHHAVWYILARENFNPWVSIWPMFIGDTLGALLLLYAFKFALGRVKINSH